MSNTKQEFRSYSSMMSQDEKSYSEFSDFIYNTKKIIDKKVDKIATKDICVFFLAIALSYICIYKIADIGNISLAHHIVFAALNIIFGFYIISKGAKKVGQLNEDPEIEKELRKFYSFLQADENFYKMLSSMKILKETIKSPKKYIAFNDQMESIIINYRSKKMSISNFYFFEKNHKKLMELGDFVKIEENKENKNFNFIHIKS